MAKFEFVDDDSEDFFDAIVEVGFDRTLNPLEITQLLQLILDTVTSRVAFNLFEGFVSLELHGLSLKTRFRYSRQPDLRTNFEHTGKERSMLLAQFIFYLFAKIDSQYPLSDVPFPSDFRGWLYLTDDLDEP